MKSSPRIFMPSIRSSFGASRSGPPLETTREKPLSRQTNRDPISKAMCFRGPERQVGFLPELAAFVGTTSFGGRCATPRGVDSRRVFEIIGILFFLVPYTFIIIFYGLDFVSRSYNLNEVSSALTGLSHRWIIKSFIPFGMLLLFLAGLSILLKNISYLMVQAQKDKQKLALFFKKYPEFKDT